MEHNLQILEIYLQIPQWVDINRYLEQNLYGLFAYDFASMQEQLQKPALLRRAILSQRDDKKMQLVGTEQHLPFWAGQAGRLP